MIPGKKYKPEDFLEIAWRRKWVIVLPLVLASVGTFLWTLTLPNRYRSEAVVLVVPPRIPQKYVNPSTTENLNRRLQAMKQEILSRSALEPLILEFNLYSELRKRALMDDAVVQMQKDVDLVVAKARRREDPGSFTVSYASDTARTAMEVTDRIASLFVRANLERRHSQASTTTQFLQSQLDEALRRLNDQEAKLEAFRSKNAGRLPNEVNSNLQMLKTAQDQVQSLNTSINQDRDRQLVIERTIADETALGAIPVVPRGAVSGEKTAGKPITIDANAPAAQQLVAARSQLAQLELRLTPDHPDVRAAKRRIAELEQKASDEALQRPLGDDTVAGGATAADITRQKRIASLRTEHDSLDRRIAAKREQIAALEAQQNNYRSRVDTAPKLESEEAGLLRDYTILKDSYTTLLKKREEAELSANLEEREVGEQFRIIDSARMPQRPNSPDRMRLNMMGALGGLVFGLVLAALLEYRDTTLRTEDDVIVALSLPVVALVPTIHAMTARPTPPRRRQLWIGSSVVLLLVLGFTAVVLWKTDLLGLWVR